MIRQAQRERRAAAAGQPLRRDRAALAAALPVALVALVAGKVSYSHITALGMRTHQGYADSHLLFLPIDGLIVAGTVLLLYGSLLGWLGVALGVAATLFANLQFGLPHGALPAVVSTWPAIAFSVACFMLERWLRSRRRGQPDGAVPPPVPEVATSVRDAAKVAYAASVRGGNPLSERAMADRFGLPRSQARKLRAEVAADVRRRVLAGSNGHNTGTGTE